MWDELELRDLRVFLVLAEELHFGRTASRLYLSQSRVSQSIRSLEARLGSRLFERTSRRVELTPVGAEFRKQVGPAYESLRDAVMSVYERTANRVTGVLRLGLPNPASGGPRLVEIVRRFREANPLCEVRIVASDMLESPLQHLRQGSLDVVAFRLPLDDDDLEIGPILSTESRVLLVAADDPLAARDWVDYDDVGERPVSRNPFFPTEMMDEFIPPITATGRMLNRIDNVSIEQLMLRVALGEQVHPTVASWLEYHPHPGVKAVAIRDLPLTRTALISLRSVHSPRVTAFINAARDVLAEA
ncbi:LysR family transcriptional regulator [Subtercola lobariae]|uniref:LysR family transcriptional regulator n=1 Tax=Subtercola lobariae TaxID=1588641 RepID=A0A917EZP7_9MICO|nr:LysR family transcriptional regulator [Subtercola lobariae]GGF27900.1 LysR family transcriptional regulator [Subtercola lobariae]